MHFISQSTKINIGSVIKDKEVKSYTYLGLTFQLAVYLQSVTDYYCSKLVNLVCLDKTQVVVIISMNTHYLSTHKLCLI